jgi:uncharacterized protein (DUF58 family)
MEKERKLNVDISGSTADFESVMKEFYLKTKLYRMLFTAKSLDFDGYRDYSTLDDASTIDWKATVRANRTLVRKYKEEEDLKVVFLIDMGENMVLGSKEKLKCEYATEVAAALSHFIMSTKDKVGYIFFSNEVIDYIVPGRGDNHFRLAVDILTRPQNYVGGSDLKKAMTYFLEYVHANAAIIISDFSAFDESVKETLNLMSSKVETMALVIRDPLDKTLPSVSGELVVENPRTGKQILISPNVAKKSYEANVAKKEAMIREAFTSSGVDFAEFMTDAHFVPILAEFLKARVEEEK